MQPGKLFIGTCSWNYPSWVGLVYSKKQRKAADYLQEYSQTYNTVEIDSWFYKIPSSDEVQTYLDQVPDDFKFTCKVTQNITLTHQRNFKQPRTLIPNDEFLSVDLFNRYTDSIQEMLPHLNAIMLEFEYLNKSKMRSQTEFLDKLHEFFNAVDSTLPMAIEMRNGSYLNQTYFRFLNEHGIIPVLSEKMYLPHVYETFDRYRELINGNVVLRLLGDDRKSIEVQTNKEWDKIVAPKPGRDQIARITLDIRNEGHDITVNVNNHYEGSAPLTIRELMKVTTDV